MMRHADLLPFALRSLALLAAASLAACAGLPEPTAPAAVKPMAQYATERSFSQTASAWPVEAWWTAYRDPQLDTLVAEALAGAPNLAAAEARLRRAQAAVESSRGATRPQLSANSSATEQKQSQNYLSPAAATPDGWHDYGRATLDLSWDLDLWGRNRAALAAATSEAEAAAADAAQARLVLATSVASAYTELARLHAAHDVAAQSLEVRAKTAELFRHRLQQGMETVAGVRQVESRHAAAQADVLALEEQLALLRNRIAALLGAGPDRGLAIARPSVDLSQPLRLPRQVQADLLGRRPDVVAARLRVESGEKRIAQARAAFYPNVNLMAFVGFQSLGLDMLAKSGSQIGSIGPAVSLPIFDGGRLRGQLRGSEADHAEAVANYDRTVAQALQEVADAATSQRALGGQLERTGAAVAAARDAWRLQNDRYVGGLATYLDVLSAEDTLLTALRTQSDLQSRSFAIDVALVRALGGGYQAPAVTSSSASSLPPSPARGRG